MKKTMKKLAGVMLAAIMCAVVMAVTVPVSADKAALVEDVCGGHEIDGVDVITAQTGGGEVSINGNLPGCSTGSFLHFLQVHNKNYVGVCLSIDQYAVYKCTNCLTPIAVYIQNISGCGFGCIA